MPRSNFIELDHRTGDGRCRICDLPYSKILANEVRDHREFHRRYLQACDSVGAPVNEAERKRLFAEGLWLQEHGLTLAERVKGAEMWLIAKYHEYLFGVLLYDVKHRLDLREFFTKRIEDRGLLLGNFAHDGAYEMRFRYSGHPMC
jgi:hypothetical protein